MILRMGIGKKRKRIDRPGGSILEDPSGPGVDAQDCGFSEMGERFVEDKASRFHWRRTWNNVRK
jgi:hypothetical protein